MILSAPPNGHLPFARKGQRSGDAFAGGRRDAEAQIAGAAKAQRCKRRALLTNNVVFIAAPSASRCPHSSSG